LKKAGREGDRLLITDHHPLTPTPGVFGCNERRRAAAITTTTQLLSGLYSSSQRNPVFFNSLIFLVRIDPVI
jgi:hypothetical protein